MEINKNAVRIAGILYIIGTVAGVSSVVFTQNVLKDPIDLAKVAANENQVIIGALCVLIMGLVLSLVPVVLYPILKKYNETLAIGYIVFRGALEFVGYLVTIVCWFFLLIASKEYIKPDVLDTSYLQTLCTLLIKGSDMIGSIFIIIFGLGALMFYSILYKSKLVPRWISIWGVFAIILNLITSFLIMFGHMSSFSTSNSLMNSQIFLQEMVMAVWFIVRGFNEKNK